MYHLFIAGDNEAWQGKPWYSVRSRCVREYTAEILTEKYAEFTPTQIDEMRRFPCIFGYERGWNMNPKFGLLKDVTSRQGEVRVDYELLPLEPFLTHEHLEKLGFELDIGNWELTRTHWALKDVDLGKELARQGIALPSWTRSMVTAVDISKHQFDVALSFPGEARDFVKNIAQALEGKLGPDSYFYDNNYVAQLARPGLDVFLQDIYRNRSRLIVIFIGRDYQRKEWCGIEFRAIREIILEKGSEKIMLVRLDDGAVEGIFRTDGYIDARQHSENDIANYIAQRVALLP